MPNQLVHFAIEADDVDRARTFYTAVFGWLFEPWGHPNFYRIGNAGIYGALQQRQGPAESGIKGFECTIAVTDLAASCRAITDAGGALLSEPFAIPTVGTLVKFRDPEGNEANIMQYEPAALSEMGLAG